MLFSSPLPFFTLNRFIELICWVVVVFSFRATLAPATQQVTLFLNYLAHGFRKYIKLAYEPIYFSFAPYDSRNALYDLAT